MSGRFCKKIINVLVDNDSKSLKALRTSQKCIYEEKELPSKRQPWRWQLRSLAAWPRTWWRRAPLGPCRNICSKRCELNELVELHCVGDCWQPNLNLRLKWPSPQHPDLALCKHQLAHTQRLIYKEDMAIYQIAEERDVYPVRLEDKLLEVRSSGGKEGVATCRLLLSPAELHKTWSNTPPGFLVVLHILNV